MRKQTYIGYTRSNWQFEEEDFGMVILPSLNKKNLVKDNVIVKVTIEEIDEKNTGEFGKKIICE